MAKKRYDTYGYSPDGKRIDMYVQDGQTYLQDGTRLPSGYTVNTKAGIFQMGDGGGYKASSHNRPTLPGYLNTGSEGITQNLGNLFKFDSDKNYAQLGQNMYKPIYDAKADAIRNRLNLDTQALNTQVGKVDRMYDRQVEAQHDMTKQAKDDYSNQTLNRGLGRSTIATTGLASMDMANQKNVNYINEGRNLALQDIHSRIQALSENAHAELGTLDSNRAIEEQNLSWQLEDRDRQHWLQEAQLNAPLMMSSQQRQWDVEDRMYDEAMEQYRYDMGLERNLAQYRPGTPEYTASLRGFEQELARTIEATNAEFDAMVQNELKRYTPGTTAYKLKQSELEEMRKMKDEDLNRQKELIKFQNSFNRSASGGRGGSYNQHDYGMYNSSQQILDYVSNVAQSTGNYKGALDEIGKLKYDMANDPQYQNMTSPSMKNMINKRISIDEKYYNNKSKYGTNWEYPQAKPNAQQVIKNDFPYGGVKPSNYKRPSLSDIYSKARPR